MTAPIKSSNKVIHVKAKSAWEDKLEKAQKANPKCRVCHKVAERVFATIINDFGERKVICSELCLSRVAERGKKNST